MSSPVCSKGQRKISAGLVEDKFVGEVAPKHMQKRNIPPTLKAGSRTGNNGWADVSRGGLPVVMQGTPLGI